MFNRTIFAVLASGTLLAAPAAAAQRWGNGPAPDSGACFYEEPNFRGRHFCARSGDELPFIPDGLNDRIMSMRVFGGAQVVVYSWSRFGGAEKWIDYDVRDLRYEGWDDRISSARLSWPRWGNRYGYRDDRDRDDRYYDGRPRGSNGIDRDRYGNGDRRDQPEFRGEAGAGRVDSTAIAEAMVRKAYEDLLHREPDAGGLQQYRDKVLKEGWTDAQLRNSIMQSPEYKQKNPGR
jgi:hypothetical protein